MMWNQRCLGNGTVLGVLALLMLGVTAGCVDKIRRGQSPDNSLLNLSDESDTKFIGRVCGVRGLRPTQVEGIGLAVGLEGTGSEPAPSGQKDYLVRDLRTSKLTENAKAAIASKNTAMVLVRGWIPPAARKGDPIDLEVIVPPRSETESLKYGQLLKTDLRPFAPLGRSVKLGKVMGKAKGPILVNSVFESSTDKQAETKGVILGGGTIGFDRELSLVVNTEDSTVKLTRAIAHAINQRYSTYSGNSLEETANPVTDRVVELVVPNEYEYNIGRFVQSLQAMAYGESNSERVARLKDLERRISEPTTSRRAAIELEAIGKDGLTTLKQAMQHPDFEVRFYVSESLAYMGESDGINVLKIAAESEPAFRWHALTALASLDNAESKAALKWLLDVESAVTRYGAFKALKACCPDDPKIRGTLLSDEFYFHYIPSDASSMIHFARSRRPEIVVFGNDRVAEDFIFVQAGLTVRAIDRDRVRVIRYDPVEGEIRLTCSSSITELIKTLTRFNIDYATLLELCQEADGSGTLNSRLVVDAAPRIGSKSMSDSVTQNEELSDKYISNDVPGLFADQSESTESLE